MASNYPDAAPKRSAWIVAVVTLFLGVLLPTVTDAVGIPPLVNIVWASLYGLGGAVIFALYGNFLQTPSPVLFAAISLIIYPITLSLLIATFYRGMVARLPQNSLNLIFVITALMNMPIDPLAFEWLNCLPLYIRYLEFR